MMMSKFFIIKGPLVIKNKLNYVLFISSCEYKKETLETGNSCTVQSNNLELVDHIKMVVSMIEMYFSTKQLLSAYTLRV